jgi:hypothetical protein
VCVRVFIHSFVLREREGFFGGFWVKSLKLPHSLLLLLPENLKATPTTKSSVRAFCSTGPHGPIMPNYWPRTFTGVGGSFYAGLVGVILILVAPQTQAYNDENPMLKWSPNYLFGSGSDGVGSRVPKSVYAYDNTFSPRVRNFISFFWPTGVNPNKLFSS